MALKQFGPGCCCCSIDVILIYNSNAITDDDFNVFLNGTSIGTRNGLSPLCKASIWSAGSAISVGWTGFPSGCSPVSVETFSLDASLFVNGSNTLTLNQAANNGSGNFGALQIVRLSQSGGSYAICKTWLDTNYSGVPPMAFSFTWNP